MADKILARSGVAVCLVAEWLKWKPSTIIQVGIGVKHKEADIMKHAWPEAELIGFEPHPDILKGLKKKGKEYPGILFETALSSFSGKAQLHSRIHSKDGASLYPHILREGLEPKDRLRQFTVDVSTLDGVFDLTVRGLKGSALLWMDCEGSELEVLKGGEETLERVEVVNVETTSKPLGYGWCSPLEVHEWLTERGFFRQWLHTMRSVHGQVDVIYVREHLFKPEFCCCPCEIKRYGEQK